MSDPLLNLILACIGIPLFLVGALFLFITGVAIIDAIDTYCHGRHIEQVLDRFRQNRQ
jgi:hypothetical protein